MDIDSFHDWAMHVIWDFRALIILFFPIFVALIISIMYIGDDDGDH